MGSAEQRLKALAATNRAKNVSADSNSARSAAHAQLKETKGVITREDITKASENVAAQQKVDREKTASRANYIAQGPNSKPVSTGKSFVHPDNKAAKGN